jgi:hypothetical protein
MTERRKFKIPDEIREKYTGRKCHNKDKDGNICGGAVFLIDDVPVCGKCSIEKAKKQAQEVIQLGEFYNQKQEEKGKKRSTLEKSTGDVLTKNMGGTKWPK